MGRIGYRIYQLFWTGLDWLYPPHCGGCDQPGSRWCANCQAKTHIIREPFCPVCGGFPGSAELCLECLSSMPTYTKLRSWAIYDGNIRNAILQLKYHGNIAMAEIFSRPLIGLLSDLGWILDLIIPVPSSIARREQRGYNQAALIAYPIALKTGFLYKPEGLLKIRDTSSQVGLSAVERKANIVRAFQANPEIVAGKRVLIVDDITTSGATIRECSNAVLAAGAEQVYGLTLARATVNVHI